MSGKRDVGSMSTVAVVDGAQTAFTITKNDMLAGLPAIFVTGLAGVEEAYLWMSVGTATPVWTEVEDADGQATYSITRKHFTVATPGDYAITKDLTAGALMVSIEGL
jgi:hypothetical protein